MSTAIQSFGRLAPWLRRTLLGGGSWFFAPLAGLYLLALGVYGFVFLVDPYDLRPFGLPTEVKNRAYPDAATPRLVSAVAKSGADLVVIGASTSMAYTPEMLHTAFPDAKRAFNLSMPGLRIDEMKIIVDQLLEKDPALKRLILVVDVTALNDIDMLGRALPKRYYERRWHDPVPDFDSEGLRVSINAVRTGVLENPGWPSRGPLPNWANGMVVLTERPEDLAKMQRAADLTRSTILDGVGPACADIDGVVNGIVPIARKAAGRGVEVEVLTAPFAMSVYSDWTVNWPAHHWIRGDGIYANLLALRRCTVQGLDGIPRVRVHSLDADVGFIDQMANYYDSAHLLRVEAYQHVLDTVAARSRVLTRENFVDYERRLASAVRRFDPGGALRTQGDKP